MLDAAPCLVEAADARFGTKDDPRLRLYMPSCETDAMLAAWWTVLMQSGELEQTLGAGATALSHFYGLFAPPAVLFYVCDERGTLTVALLVTPILSGAAFATVWVAPVWRRLERGRSAIDACYDAAFTLRPILLGCTRQPRLLAVHRRWGYDVWGKLPGAMDGYDAWIVVLTESAYRRAKEAGRPRPARRFTSLREHD